MRSLAAQLNDSKAMFLQKLRKQFLHHEASFPEDEDIDVDLVVKRAVDRFEREKEEILLCITNDHK